MKKAFVAFLTLLFASTASANPPILWGPNNAAQILQSGVTFTPSSGPGIYTGSANPTLVTTFGTPGSLYLSTGGSAYQKTDTGTSTNWSLLTTGSTISWGSITGTLSSQTDLNSALALLAPLASPTFTGLVTAASLHVSGGTTLTGAASITGGLFAGTGSTLAGPIQASGSTLSGAGNIGTAGTVTGALLKQSTGFTNGDCIEFGSSGQLTDAGAACGSGGGGSGQVSSGTLDQMAWYGATGTTVSGNTNITATTAGNLSAAGTLSGAAFSVSGGSTVTGATSMTGGLFAGTGSTLAGPVNASGSTLSGAGNFSTAGTVAGALIKQTTGFTSGDCIQFGSSGQLTDAGAACGSGGGGTGLTTPTTGSTYGNSTAASITGINVSSYGVGAGVAETSGGSNTFFGFDAGNANTTGTSNVFIGPQAGLGNVSGTDNIGIGNSAFKLNNSAGNFNIGVGSSALQANTFGGGNVAIGYEALQSNTGGSQMVAVGEEAALSVSSNSAATSVFLGYNSGEAGTAATIPVNDTLIGANSQMSGSGTITGATCIGHDCVVSANDQIVLGISANTTFIPGAFSLTGSSTMTGAMSITGALSVGGNITNADTLSGSAFSFSHAGTVTGATSITGGVVASASTISGSTLSGAGQISTAGTISGADFVGPFIGATTISGSTLSGLGNFNTAGTITAGSVIGLNGGFFQKAIQFVDAAASSSSGTAYTTTTTTATITPTSASNRVKISVVGSVLDPDPATDNLFVSVFRGATDLSSGGNGFCNVLTSSLATGVVVPCSFTFIDSPATASSTVYTVKIKTNSGITTWNYPTGSAVIILEEIE